MGKASSSHTRSCERLCTRTSAPARARAHARAAAILAGATPPRSGSPPSSSRREPAGDPERVELLRRVAADALARRARRRGRGWAGRWRSRRRRRQREEVLVELSSAQLRLGTPEAAIDQLMAATEAIREPDLLTTATRLVGAR